MTLVLLFSPYNDVYIFWRWCGWVWFITSYFCSVSLSLQKWRKMLAKRVRNFPTLAIFTNWQDVALVVIQSRRTWSYLSLQHHCKVIAVLSFLIYSWAHGSQTRTSKARLFPQSMLSEKASQHLRPKQFWKTRSPQKLFWQISVVQTLCTTNSLFKRQVLPFYHFEGQLPGGRWRVFHFPVHH